MYAWRLNVESGFNIRVTLYGFPEPGSKGHPTCSTDLERTNLYCQRAQERKCYPKELAGDASQTHV